MIDFVKGRDGQDLYDFQNIEEALNSLEQVRKSYLDTWMESGQYDLIAFPTNGDVPKADSDEIYESMLSRFAGGSQILERAAARSSI